jgi:hypothetical protein
MLEFLDLARVHAETDPHRGNLKEFLIELGYDLCFAGSGVSLAERMLSNTCSAAARSCWM